MIFLKKRMILIFPPFLQLLVRIGVIVLVLVGLLDWGI
jgi:hypothetical protein